MPTAPTPIDAGPAVPNANDPEATFDAMFEASLTWQKDDLQPQANALAENVYDNAVEAAASAVAADASADAAALSEAAAATYAASAINAPGTQATSSTSMSLSLGVKTPTLDQTGKAYGVGQQLVFARSSAPATRMFARLDAFTPGTGAMSITVQSFEGSGGPYTDWVVNLGTATPAGTPDMPREARTSNTALVDADKGKYIDITSGTFTQTFGTRTAGWWCILGNSGTGDVGLTTDGVTYYMYPQEKRYVVYDGTTDYTIVLNSYMRTFSGSGLWTKPPGYARHAGLLWGGGAGGLVYTDGSTQWLRYGGGGGGCTPFSIPSSTLTATVALTLGSGGAFTTTSTRSQGGNSTFGAFVTGYGAGSAQSGAGGLPTFTSITHAGIGFQSPHDSTVLNTATANPGINAEYGGGNGGYGRNLSGNVTTGASGGDSIWGGGGGACSGSSSSPGTGGKSIHGGVGGDSTTPAGTFPGGGGYGGTGGNGAGGGLRIWGEI